MQIDGVCVCVCARFTCAPYLVKRLIQSNNSLDRGVIDVDGSQGHQSPEVMGLRPGQAPGSRTDFILSFPAHSS